MLLPGIPLIVPSATARPEKTTLGRALLLETQAQWYGSFDLRDRETMSVYRAYVKGAS